MQYNDSLEKHSRNISDIKHILTIVTSLHIQFLVANLFSFTKTALLFKTR